MTDETCTWCKKRVYTMYAAGGQGEEMLICTGCERVVPICECFRDLGRMDGWLVSARRTWGYDQEGYQRKWGFGNAIEMILTKEDDDLEVGIVHVQRTTVRATMLAEIVNTLSLPRAHLP